jgi:hypothetical protein
VEIELPYYQLPDSPWFTGSQYIVVSYTSITFKHKVFGLSYYYGKPVSQILARIQYTREVNSVCLTSTECSIVKGVGGGGGKGLKGTTMAGDDIYHDEGQRGQLGGCRYVFRHGSKFHAEILFDAT